MSENYDVTEMSIRAERFLKKNKFIILFIIVVVIVVFAAKKITTSIAEHKAEQSSQLYFQAIDKDESKLAQLKELNPNLYAAALIKLHKKVDVDNIDPLLSDLSKASIGQSNVFLQDLDTIKKAYAALKAKDITSAHKLAKEIGSNSEFYALAQTLLHIKVEK